MNIRRFEIIALALFVIIAIAAFPVALSQDTLGSDAAQYSGAAVHLADSGMFSLDGQTAYTEREPGLSFFYALIYLLFGAENRVAIFIVQLLLYAVASIVFTRELKEHTGKRASDITLLLLLTLPSGFHVQFSAFREGFVLSLFLMAGWLFLLLTRRRSSLVAGWLGIVLGIIIFTYLPMLFLPWGLVALAWWIKFSKEQLIALLIIPFVLVGFWSVRNYAHTGSASIAGTERTAFMWYVRGEQAEHVTGLEPFNCLWAEYISRDWSGRSHACSFNALVNTKWPGRVPTGNEAQIAAESKEKILQHFPNYLWFSVFEILELHLPFVNGWGFWYNILAALSSVILYAGTLLALPVIFARKYWFFWLCIGYTTAIFILTDATPRYLMPIIFCYCVFAGVGFDQLLRRFK